MAVNQGYAESGFSKKYKYRSLRFLYALFVEKKGKIDFGIKIIIC